jgi:hypothetical protein
LVAATDGGDSNSTEKITRPENQGDSMTSLQAVRARFARNEGLPFADVLTEASILDVRKEQGVRYRDRVFSPITTILGFRSQVLSEDHSCRDAVSRIIAHRAASGATVCSPNTASYCNARGRLLMGVLSSLAKRTAQQLQASAAEEWKWNGRSVFIADGSHVSMPDTQENQASYPQPPTQQPGLGFPLARLTVLLSLATGAGHDLAIASYEGKGTGETTLLRAMDDSLKPGDVLLADAQVDNYFLICELRDRGIDFVARAQYQRVGSQPTENRPVCVLCGDALPSQDHRLRSGPADGGRQGLDTEWFSRRYAGVHGSGTGQRQARPARFARQHLRVVPGLVSCEAARRRRSRPVLCKFHIGFRIVAVK